jgi:hypothetical protein
MFLLLACADLAFPQLCGEDNEPLFPIRSATASTLAHADASGEQQPHQAPAEDCFCCCSHILSAESTSPLTELAIVSDSERMTQPGVPIAPLTLLFHPPRLA